MRRICIINGPNLNLLERRGNIYGGKDLASLASYTSDSLQKYGLEYQLEWFQSNGEGELIGKLHQIIMEQSADGVVINPGAYAHTGLALADSLECLEIPAVEVHITNIFKRESIRQTILTGKNVKTLISGGGVNAYLLGIFALHQWFS